MKKIQKSLKRSLHCIAEVLGLIMNDEELVGSQDEIGQAVLSLEKALSNRELAISSLHKTLNTDLEDLEVSTRLTNCFANLYFLHVGSLVQLGELDYLKLKNFGRKSLKELKKVLAERGLSLGMSTGGWIPSCTLVAINGKWIKVAEHRLGWEQILKIHDPLVENNKWKVCFQHRWDPKKLLSPGDSVKLLPGMMFWVEPLVSPREETKENNEP